MIFQEKKQQRGSHIVVSRRRLIKRFLLALVIISILILPGLIWSYFVINRLPSDVRIASPIFIGLLGFTFIVCVRLLIHLDPRIVEPGFLGKVFDTALLIPGMFDLFVVVLMHLEIACVAGFLWLNMSLLFENTLSGMPLWIWCFGPALLSYLALIVIGSNKFPSEVSRKMKLLEPLKSFFDLDILLPLFSCVLSALSARFVVGLINSFIVSRVSNSWYLAIQIILNIMLPLMIGDLTLLISILWGVKRDLIESAYRRRILLWQCMAKRIRRLVLIHPLLTALFCTGSLFILCLAVFRVGYGVNDDIEVIAIASGYLGGKPFPFLVYSNVILGFALNFLYQFTAKINWEIWLFVLIHFISVWVLVYIIFKHFSVSWRIQGLGLLIVLFGEIYFLLNITFTTVAAVASLSGFCLILTAVRSETIPLRYSFTLGGFLIFIASLIRIESLVLIILILLPFIVANFRSLILESYVTYLGIICLLVLGAYAFDKFYLNLFPNWLSYTSYNLTRSMLHDTPRLANMDGFVNSVHWSDNDLEMFSRWFFPDRITYSHENLQYLVNHVSDRRPDILSWILSLPDYLSNSSFLPYTFMLVSLWLGMLFFNKDLMRILAVSVLTIGLIFLIMIYLEWRQKAPDRIFLFSLWACIVISLFNMYWVGHFGESAQSGFSDRQIRFGFLGLIFSLIVLVGGIVLQSIQTTQLNIARQNAYQQILSDVRNLESRGSIPYNALIVSAAYGIPWEWSNPMFMKFPDIQYFPTNWETFSPAYDNVLREYQIKSLPESLFQNSNIYLMVDNSTMRVIVQFIKEHYGVNVVAKTIYIIPSRYVKGTVYDGVTLFKLLQAP